MSEPFAYLNGQWIPASQAAVPVWDAGFVLGTTCTEQLRTFGGKLFRLDRHLARLHNSLQTLGLDADAICRPLPDLCQELVGRNWPILQQTHAGSDLGLAVLVTPGAYASFAPGENPSGTLCLHTYRLPLEKWATRYRHGAALATSQVQQVPAECWPPALKCRSRVHYYLADQEVSRRQPGAQALLLDAQGNLTETPTANVLIYRQEEGIFAPPPEAVLPGVSAAVVWELAEQLGLKCGHRPLRPTDVATADEVFLTSTPFCLLPVTQFDGQKIGSGQPGPIFQRTLSAWSQLVGLDIQQQAEKGIAST